MSQPLFQNLRSLLAANIVVTSGYLLLGMLGIFLTGLYGQGSPFWPAAGLALAVAMVYGKAIFSGLALGAFIVQFYAFWSVDGQTDLIAALVFAIGTGIGVCLQAFLGAWLVNRFVGQDDPLLEESKIIRFIFLGSFAACLVAPSIGILSLNIFQEIDIEDIFSSWLKWWLGDVIGVILFAPIVLCFIARPLQLWHKRIKLVALPLFFIFVLTATLYEISLFLEKQRLDAIFHQDVHNVEFTLQNSLKDHEEINQFIKAFFDSSLFVSEEEFHTLTLPILHHHRSIQALEWIPAISATVRKQYESQWRRGHKILERNEQGQLVEAGNRDFYYPITYIQPPEGNERAFGYDVGSNSQARAALLKARDTGKCVVALPIHLVQDTVEKTGVIFYSPVYKKNTPIDTVQQRRQAFAGVVATVARINDIVNNVFVGDKPKFNVTLSHRGKIIFTNDVTPLHFNHLSLVSYKEITLADQKIKISYLPTSSFFRVHITWGFWWLVAVIVFLTGLSTFILMLLAGRTLRTEQLVNERTRELSKSERRFRMMIQDLSVIFWRIDPDTLKFTFVSNEAEKILGYPVQQWLDEDDFWIKHMHPEDRKWVPEFCKEKVKKHLKHEMEYRMINRNGEVVWLKDFVSINVEQGEREEIVGMMIDITESRQTEQALRVNEQKYKILFENALEALVIFDIENFCVVEANENALALFGIQTDQLGIINPLDVSPAIQSNGVASEVMAQQYINKLLADEQVAFEWIHLNGNGEEILCEINMALLPSLGHKLAVISIRDITEKKKSEQEIYQLAFYDALTGLANRRLLLNQLETELSVAKRNYQYGAVLFLDLDRFKILNDSLGHHIGDELLFQVAQRIKSVLREEDLAARMGGDEFVIMIRPHANSLEQCRDSVMVIAEKIRTILEQPYIISDYEHHCSSSIGITLFPEPNISASELLQQADKAMYRAKEQGRNTICFFHPSMQQVADDKLFLEKELRRALKHQHFKLYYQPQTDAGGKIISVEALIRWHHPERGVISPAQFIPIAEDSGLIIALGVWVLNQACWQMKKWLDQGMEMEHVSINVSSRQFRQADFVNTIEQALENNKLDASRLCVELTEGIVINDIDDTVAKMKALKRMGIKISIDDFGTGYSSLAYLKQLPLNQLKIDQSFVRDLTIDLNDAIIVSTIINMAHNLQLEVIAEGVETEQQKEYLLQKGCRVFQGYYFSKPLPVDDFRLYWERMTEVS